MYGGVLESPETREDGPWWARWLMWFIRHYGVPTVVALALGALFIYIAIGDVKAIRADVETAKSEVNSVHNDLLQHNLQMTKDSQAARDLHELEIRILQAMCYNAAKSDAARYACAGGK